MINWSSLRDIGVRMEGSFIYSFYAISIKKDYNGKLKYGQNYYDFDEGVMTFSRPVR